MLFFLFLSLVVIRPCLALTEVGRRCEGACGRQYQLWGLCFQLVKTSGPDIHLVYTCILVTHWHGLNATFRANDTVIHHHTHTHTHTGRQTAPITFSWGKVDRKSVV